MTNQTPDAKQGTPWPLIVIVALFSLVGIIGMVVVMLGGADNADDIAEDGASIPTPAPLITTPVPTLRPTATARSVMDAPVPDIELTNAEGEAFSLDDLRGQVVVVNFWATWCPPCVEEMPALQAYAQTHPDITILAVTNPEDGQTMATVQDFIAEYGLTDLRFGYDANNRLQFSFNALNLPTTFVIDAEGIVRFRQIGLITADDLDFYLAELS